MTKTSKDYIIKSLKDQKPKRSNALKDQVFSFHLVLNRVELLPGFKFTGKMVKKNKFTGKIGKKR